MSFANSQSTVLEWCVDLTFPTNPPVTTSVDVNPTGNVPILMSLSQMQNLEFDLKLKPEGNYLTCAQRGATNELLKMATSRHAVLDWSRLKGNWLIKTDMVQSEQALTFFTGIDFQSPEEVDPETFAVDKSYFG